MKVINLEIKDVKRIRHIVITPNGWVVKLTGANAQGKSSTIDSLMYLLEGKRSLPADPRRNGVDKASIEADFGGIKVLRKFTAKGSYLTVIDSQGEVQSGQEFLNKLLGENATDAMSFMSKKPIEQKRILARLAGADTSEIDGAIEKAYQARTLIGHYIDRLKAQYQTVKFTPDVPEKEIPIADLMDKLNEANDVNGKIKELNRKKELAAKDLAGLMEQLVNIKKWIVEKEEEIKSIDSEYFGLEAIDDMPIKTEIANLDKTNSIIRANAAYMKTKTDLEAKEKEFNAKDKEVESKRAEKTKLLQAAKYPVPGLCLRDDCVTLNGIPLDEASGAEQIIVGLAILSAVIPKDGIRILRIKNGSIIDDANMKFIEGMAEREQVQIWIEIVQSEPSDGDGTEIFIKDGEVLK
jgi:hypothetical protein